MSEQPEVTVLLPCLNEAETIGTCVDTAWKGLAKLGVPGEVLVADNGSKDGSAEIARDHGARVVDVPALGYGCALIVGIAAARGRYVIMADADGSYDVGNLDLFLENLRAGYDLVVGNRFRGGIAPGAMPPLHRYLGNPLLTKLGRRLFQLRHVGDFHCGIRGFDRRRINALQLRSPGMEIASEMIVRSALAGYRVIEVPAILQPDGRSRRPHLRPWRDGWRHLVLLLNVATQGHVAEAAIATARTITREEGTATAIPAARTPDDADSAAIAVPARATPNDKSDVNYEGSEV